MMNFEERQKARAQRIQNETSNGGQQQNNSEQQEHKLSAKIDIQSIEMEGLTKSKFITSRDLGKMINKAFRVAMPEYEGSRVYPNGYNVVADVFFAERSPNTDFSNGKIKVLQRLDQKNKEGKRNAVSIITSYNGRNKSNVYELTQQGRDALSEFIDPMFFKGAVKDGKVEWKKVTSEVTERTGYSFQNNERVLYKVQIDVRRLLSKIYGSKNGKSPLMYDVTICRPLNSTQDPTTGNIFSTEWLLTIVQLDKDALDKALNDAGIASYSSNLNINRD